MVWTSHNGMCQQQVMLGATGALSAPGVVGVQHVLEELLIKGELLCADA